MRMLNSLLHVKRRHPQVRQKPLPLSLSDEAVKCFFRPAGMTAQPGRGKAFSAALPPIDLP